VRAAPSPDTISYQGFLTDAAGTPVNSTVNMNVAFYDASPGGTLLYAEDHDNVTVSDGQFNLELGTGTATTGTWGALDFSKALWIEVTVGGEKLDPRIPLSAVAYARYAFQSQQIGTLTANQWCAADATGSAIDCDQGAPVASVSATANKGISITGSATAPTVGLATSGCSNNQVMKFDGANWACAADATGGGGMSDVVDDTTPQLGGQLDVNGNAIGDGTRELLKFTEDGAAVNEITIANAATGSSPRISATGGDTDVGITLDTKGAGQINISKDGATAYSLPNADGSTNQVMQTDGSGALSWTTVSSGGISDVVDDTTPQLGGHLDVNGQVIGDGTLELLKFTETGSAVNELTIANAATGSGPTISSSGDNTTIDLNLAPKGTGVVNVNTSKITNVTDPSAAQDAATKSYVDNLLPYRTFVL